MELLKEKFGPESAELKSEVKEFVTQWISNPPESASESHEEAIEPKTDKVRS